MTWLRRKAGLRVTDFDMYETCRPIFETPTMSMKELAKLRQTAYMHFYLRRGYYFDKRRRLKLNTALVVAYNLVAYIKLRLKK